MRQAVRFIQDNLSQPLHLGDLSSYLNISGRHLSRLFVDELGKSYMDFVLDERIRAATALIHSSDLSIKEIAKKTGFNTVHYFTRVFARLTGIPPGEYRKRRLVLQ